LVREDLAAVAKSMLDRITALEAGAAGVEVGVQFGARWDIECMTFSSTAVQTGRRKAVQPLARGRVGILARR
jgi:hypothetical protein